MCKELIQLKKNENQLKMDRGFESIFFPKKTHKLPLGTRKDAQHH